MLITLASPVAPAPRRAAHRRVSSVDTVHAAADRHLVGAELRQVAQAFDLTWSELELPSSGKKLWR